MNLLERAYDYGERKGYAVSKHPSGTVTVKNFREYALIFPQGNGTVYCEVREPLYEAHVRKQVRTEFELLKLLGGLK